MRLERARLQFGMVLHADEPGMVFAISTVSGKDAVRRRTGKIQTAIFQLTAIADIDFVSVPVALRNAGRFPIDFGNLRTRLQTWQDRRRAAWYLQGRRLRCELPWRCPWSIPSSVRQPVRLSARIRWNWRRRYPPCCARPQAPPSACRNRCRNRESSGCGQNCAAAIFAFRSRAPRNRQAPGCRERPPDRGSDPLSRIVSDSIHSRLTFTRFAIPPCTSASISDL